MWQQGVVREADPVGGNSYKRGGPRGVVATEAGGGEPCGGRSWR
jgi:hypothetical protein